MTSIIISETPYRSAAYDQCVQLRDEVLRKPLGLKFTDEEREQEQTNIHVVCHDGEDVIGCLVLVPQFDHVIKMRQVAVARQAQNRGIGRALTIFAENLARSRGFTRMILHARETAVPFYEKLGYRKVGEPFEEVTLRHWKMEKDL